MTGLDRGEFFPNSCVQVGRILLLTVNDAAFDDTYRTTTESHEEQITSMSGYERWTQKMPHRTLERKNSDTLLLLPSFPHYDIMWDEHQQGERERERERERMSIQRHLGPNCFVNVKGER